MHDETKGMDIHIRFNRKLFEFNVTMLMVHVCLYFRHDDSHIEIALIQEKKSKTKI